MKFRYLLFTIISMLFLALSCSDNSVSDSETEEEVFTYNHEVNPGESTTDFLTADSFEDLVIEIDYMQGYAPTQESLDNLQQFLEERLNKTSITILNPTEIPAVGQSEYTADEIRDLERQHRDEFSEEGLLTAYFIFVDSEFAQANVLGIAHFNTSMALFGETIEGASGGVGQVSREDIETIVMRHEFGHIIGLVNNGADMQTNHQDTGNGRHCDVDSCLMYYSVRTTDFFANVFGGNIPELDDQCITDLQAAGGK